MLNEDFRNQNYVLGQRSFRNDKTETNNKRGHDCKPMDRGVETIIYVII